jgi:anti-sigma regulatory factor (Ser/Thr protein kinase)
MEKRFLIARWLREQTQPIAIYDEASVSSTRQRVRAVGSGLNLDTETIESAALITSELAHNQLVHARRGYIAVKPIERRDVTGLEITAADTGPGITNLGDAIKDKTLRHSGSLGAGLEAVYRIADEVEFDSRIDEGTCIVARKFRTRPVALCCEVAIMGRPCPGEGISGDDSFYVQSESGFFAAVADGLGHGPEAREASNRAVETLIANAESGLAQVVTTLNRELAATRGCAMSIVRFNKHDRAIECTSLGDVHAHIYKLREANFFASTPFIVGDGELPKQRIRIEKGIAEPGAVLVMFSDGLKSRTSLKGQLEVLRQPAIAIAQHLLENDSRPDDDALVLVARFIR